MKKQTKGEVKRRMIKKSKQPEKEKKTSVLKDPCERKVCAQNRNNTGSWLGMI